MQKILTTNNAKILKSSGEGYMTAGIHFAPASLSGFNVCPMASKGCKLACLHTSGHGRYARVQNARIAKTQRFFQHREEFMTQLIKEIASFERKCDRNDAKCAVRLNLTSDIQWENILFGGKTLFDWFPAIQFYDYTKIVKRVLPNSKARAVENYHLTFSRSESNQSHVELAMAAGANVAVVFAGKELPAKYLGRKVVSGDKNDLRFLDDAGVVVGLTTKGRAKHDKSGFVVEAQPVH